MSQPDSSTTPFSSAPESSTVTKGGGLFAPFGYAAYRAIWIANLFANLGMWAQSVASAWVMTEAQGSALMIAMIQVASAVPLVVLSIVAGVLADNYDRRRLMLIGITLQSLGSLFITAVAVFSTLTPELLILSILGISMGSALTTPAWQAAVNEQVPRTSVANAVLLNSVNYNVARALGPALGGILLSWVSAGWVFLLNSVCCGVLIVAIWRWHREVPSHRLPPERIIEGMRAALHFTHYSSVTRLVMLRAFTFGMSASAIWALLPLLAKHNPSGNASVYGYMLGALGIGAIMGSLGVERVRRRVGTSRVISLAAIVYGVVMVVLGCVESLWLLFPALFLGGAGWIAAVSTYNAAVQLLVPDWVKARALALYQTALYAGLALGSFLWGHLAETMTVYGALFTAGLVMLGCAALLFSSKLPSLDANDMVHVDTPEFSVPDMPFDHERGSVMVSIEYTIPEERTRDFVRAVRPLRKLRLRNGAERWSLYRDISDKTLWQEVFLVRNWLQHLRMLDRLTLADKTVLDTVMTLHHGTMPPRIRHGVSYKSMRYAQHLPPLPVDKKVVSPKGPHIS